MDYTRLGMEWTSRKLAWNEGMLEEVTLRRDKPDELAAHRDPAAAGPYPLRTGHLSDPKKVGRTVSVSRKAQK
jgi:hypothetical protein